MPATIADAPPVYMLSDADSDTITNYVNLFQSAYMVSSNPPTRTTISVEQKNEARI